MKIKKIPEKQLQQIIAPIVVVLVILLLFGIYHMIKLHQAEEPVPAQDITQPETGIISCEDLGCPEDSQYIGSSGSNVYHECSSGYAQTILPQNRICFYNATEAEAEGYRPAAN